MEQRPREYNIAATTRARGEEVWDREAAGVSASFPHFFLISLLNQGGWEFCYVERGGDGVSGSIRRERERERV